MNRFLCFIKIHCSDDHIFKYCYGSTQDHTSHSYQGMSLHICCHCGKVSKCKYCKKHLKNWEKEEKKKQEVHGPHA